MHIPLYGFRSQTQIQYYLRNERNKKSNCIIFLVSTHSACLYKNHSLKLFPEPQILHYLFNFFYLVLYNYLVYNKK